MFLIGISQEFFMLNWQLFGHIEQVFTNRRAYHVNEYHYGRETSLNTLGMRYNLASVCNTFNLERIYLILTSH